MDVEKNDEFTFAHHLFKRSLAQHRCTDVRVVFYGIFMVSAYELYKLQTFFPLPLFGHHIYVEILFFQLSQL